MLCRTCVAQVQNQLGEAYVLDHADYTAPTQIYLD